MMKDSNRIILCMEDYKKLFEALFPRFNFFWKKVSSHQYVGRSPFLGTGGLKIGIRSFPKIGAYWQYPSKHPKNKSGRTVIAAVRASKHIESDSEAAWWLKEHGFENLLPVTWRTEINSALNKMKTEYKMFLASTIFKYGSTEDVEHFFKENILIEDSSVIDLHESDQGIRFKFSLFLKALAWLPLHGYTDVAAKVSETLSVIQK